MEKEEKKVEKKMTTRYYLTPLGKKLVELLQKLEKGEISDEEFERLAKKAIEEHKKKQKHEE